MTFDEHTREDRVGIRLAAVGPLGVLVVHPGEDDDLGPGVVAEVEPVLLEELGPAPMDVCAAERVALTVDGGGRVMRDILEGQLQNCGEPLGAVLLIVGLRVLELGPLHVGNHGLDLVEEQRVEHDRPPVDLQDRRGWRLRCW